MKIGLLTLAFAVFAAGGPPKAPGPAKPSPAVFDYSVKVADTTGREADFSRYRGLPLFLLYFSPTCGHCQTAIQMLKKFEKEQHSTHIVGVVTGSETEKEFKAFKKKKDFPFPLYYDQWGHLKGGFSVAHVPLTLAVERGGRIFYRLEKMKRESYADVLEMAFRELRGEKGAPKLESRYYGSDACAVCHTALNAWWETTPHATAFERLTKKFFGKQGYEPGAERRIDPACLPCHTTGSGALTGYQPENGASRHLVGVQCESCHSAAGPHDGAGKTGDYEPLCARCHDPVNDPTFYFRTSLSKLAHPKEPRLSR